MDARKVTSVLNWHVPNSVNELKGFLRLTSYYRRFIKGYGFMGKPFTKLLKKGDLQWNSSAQSTFDSLKLAMVTVPMLALLDFTTEFIMESDSSNVAISDVLT